MERTVENIISGIGSILDIYGNLNIADRTIEPEKADLEALRSDWEQVGADMRWAMGAVEKNNG